MHPAPSKNLPPAIADRTIAKHLRKICELDLTPLDAVLSPKGFRRD
jgi:hypothetical protein